MPITGLTDRGLAFPEIGQIRKGAKKGTNQIGADLAHFRVEFDVLESKASKDFHTTYGATPKDIRIFLPFNEIERQWDAWLEAYTAGRMVARSDGTTIQYQVDAKGNILVKNGVSTATNEPVPHPQDNLAGKDNNGKPVKFKPVGRLKVIIPELRRAAYLTAHTTSMHDIANVSAQLAAFLQLNGGQIAGIPLFLRRRPKMISIPKPDGTRVRMAKSLLSIEADPDWVAMKLEQVAHSALPDTELLLPSEIPAEQEVEMEVDADEMDDNIHIEEGAQ